MAHCIHKKACLHTYGQQDIYLQQTLASVRKVLAQGSGGEEAHKCLDIIGQAPASHRRNLPTEFLMALGSGKGWRAERAVSAEGLAGGERKQQGETRSLELLSSREQH